MSEKRKVGHVYDFSPLLKKYEDELVVNDNPLAPQMYSNTLISAGTGQGKTNLLLNILIAEEFKMTYDEVYLCVPSIEEPAYLFLRDYMLKIREKALKRDLKELRKTDPKAKLTIDDIEENFHHISQAEDIPEPSVDGTDATVKKSIEPKKRGRPAKVQPVGKLPTPAVIAPVPVVPVAPLEAGPVMLRKDGKQKLVIIDDFTGNEIANKKLVALSQKTRKIGCSLIVLNHNLYALDSTFKDQLTGGYIMLFESSTNRKLNLYQQDFGRFLTKEEFYEAYKYATKEPHTFLMMDLKTKKREMMFRRGLDELNIAKKELNNETDDIKKLEALIMKKMEEIEDENIG